MQGKRRPLRTFLTSSGTAVGAVAFSLLLSEPSNTPCPYTPRQTASAHGQLCRIPVKQHECGHCLERSGVGVHSASKLEKGAVAGAAGARAPLTLTPEPRREAMFMLDLILIFSFLADCRIIHLSVRSLSFCVIQQEGTQVPQLLYM